MYVITSSVSGLPAASELQGGASKKTCDHLEAARRYYPARRLKGTTTLEHDVMSFMDGKVSQAW